MTTNTDNKPATNEKPELEQDDKDSKTAEPEVLSLEDEASNKNSSNGQDGEKGNMNTPKDTKRDGVEDNFKIESSEVANGFKFLILSLNAYAAKQYEEAGALFAQAAECGDVTRLTNALLEPITGHFPASQAPITTENLQQLAGDEEGDEDWEPEDEDGDESEDEQGEDSVGDAFEAESSGGAIIHRRKVTSLNQIGKMLAASMEVTASEEDPDAEGEAEEDADASAEEEDAAAGEEDTSDAEGEAEEGGEGEGDDSDTEEGDEEDTAPEPDPDVPGASLIPVSFSSAVKVKLEVGSDVKSPIRLKN